MRILIADDQALFRDGLRSLLEARGYDVVGDAGNGDEALARARRLRPDVVLMDLHMPGADGIEATRRIAAELPATRVVMLTSSDDHHDLFEAVQSGARGYLLKDLEADAFCSFLDRVGRDEPVFSPRIAHRLLEELAHPGSVHGGVDAGLLTPRERDVLEWMVAGVTSNRRLAARLRLSENTVKFHVRNILDKLHLHSRAQVVGFALRHRLVKVKDETS